ncbi:hypothetical protein BaRGS_00022034 [Batillaria attramentaria]|uniref:Granulins domain-containing protein n=1 Tax=Batillaria attramentaria TaxID=370345 RepID=A0ABD0KHR8_9CAEN
MRNADDLLFKRPLDSPPIRRTSPDLGSINVLVANDACPPSCSSHRHQCPPEDGQSCCPSLGLQPVIFTQHAPGHLQVLTPDWSTCQ